MYSQKNNQFAARKKKTCKKPQVKDGGTVNSCFTTFARSIAVILDSVNDKIHETKQNSLSTNITQLKGTGYGLSTHDDNPVGVLDCTVGHM